MSVKADTLVHLLDADKGLIGGYCVVWNTWIHGAEDGKPQWAWVDPAYRYYLDNGTPIYRNHRKHMPTGWVWKAIKTPIGLLTLGFLYPKSQTLTATKIAAGQMYFSAGAVYFSPPEQAAHKTGGRIVEVSLTDNPGTRPLPGRIEAANDRIDRMIETLQSIGEML